MSENVRMVLIVSCLITGGFLLWYLPSFLGFRVDLANDLVRDTTSLPSEVVVQSDPQIDEAEVVNETPSIEKTPALGAEPVVMVSGTLYDSATRIGIADQTIVVVPQAIDGALTAKTTTDERGRFRFSDLHDGGYEIYFKKVDGYPDNLWWKSKKRVTLNRHGATPRVDFAISKGMTIGGRVVTGTGKPVGNVRINGVDDETTLRDNEISDDDGRFLLMGFETNSRVTLSVSGQRFHQNEFVFTIKDESLSDVELLIKLSSAISGRLMTSQGVPYPKREMYLVSLQKDMNYRVATSKETTGNFIFDNLSAGTYSIHLDQYHEREPNTDPHLGTFTLGPEEQLDGLKLVVTDTMENAMSITGRIVDDLGDPIPDASVQAFMDDRSPTRSGITSRSDGTFSLPIREEGIYTITASAKRHASNYIEKYQIGSEPATIVLNRKTFIIGTVLDDATGRPVTEYTVTMGNGGGPILRDEQRTDKKLDGRFRISNVDPESKYYLRVQADDYADFEIELPEIPVGESLEDLVIKLGMAYRVQGTVFDQDGKPLKGAMISNVSRRFGSRPDALTDEDGRFVLNNVARGLLEFNVQQYGFAGVAKKLQVVRNVSNLRFTLVPEATLEVHITIDGEPAYQAYAIAKMDEVGDGRARVSGQTDSSGIAKIDGLPEGSGYVSAVSQLHQESRHSSKRFETETGKITKVEISFVTGNAVVEGSVTFDKQVEAHRIVTLQSTGEFNDEPRVVFVDPNGRYRFETVPEGTFTLTAKEQDRSDPTRETILQEKVFEGSVKEGETLSIDFVFD